MAWRQTYCGIKALMIQGIDALCVFQVCVCVCVGVAGSTIHHAHRVPVPAGNPGAAHFYRYFITVRFCTTGVKE